MEEVVQKYTIESDLRFKIIRWKSTKWLIQSVLCVFL